MDRYMQALIDSPISTAERANKLFLPEGRRAARRSAKPVYEGEALGEAVPVEQVRKMKDADRTKDMKAILDYYAGTTVPFERIAEHTNIPLNRVAECMKERGRLS